MDQDLGINSKTECWPIQSLGLQYPKMTTENEDGCTPLVKPVFYQNHCLFFKLSYMHVYCIPAGHQRVMWHWAALILQAIKALAFNPVPVMKLLGRESNLIHVQTVVGPVTLAVSCESKQLEGLCILIIFRSILDENQWLSYYYCEKNIKYRSLTPLIPDKTCPQSNSSYLFSPSWVRNHVKTGNATPWPQGCLPLESWEASLHSLPFSIAVQSSISTKSSLCCLFTFRPDPMIVAVIRMGGRSRQNSIPGWPRRTRWLHHICGTSIL